MFQYVLLKYKFLELRLVVQYDVNITETDKLPATSQQFNESFEFSQSDPTTQDVPEMIVSIRQSPEDCCNYMDRFIRMNRCFNFIQ